MKLVLQVAIKKTFALILLFFSLPFLIIIFFIVKLTSSGSFLFKQKRMGKNKKTFTCYKIRTMILNANEIKPQLYKLNEAESPAFKIKKDPRFTKIGKFLSHTGLDEIPQLINVIKGEMDFVGPRPLPIKEAKLVPKKYGQRFMVLPGITSLWVIRGTDHSSFKKWMEDDMEYVKNKTFWGDFLIMIVTLKDVIKLIVRNINH